ncbi:MAG TPA: hypothetical protein VH640_29390 [Bryobacteraceae bacterium]
MSFLESIEALSFSTWVRESPSLWAYPTVLWLHVMGMGIVAGTSAIISLRLLGVSPKTPVGPMERLYPLMWGGFWLNAITGTALVMAGATTKLVDPTFYIKMIFIFAGVVLLQRTRNKVFRCLGPDGKLPESARSLAWASLICWLGAVTAGRLLAYI